LLIEFSCIVPLKSNRRHPYSLSHSISLSHSVNILNYTLNTSKINAATYLHFQDQNIQEGSTSGTKNDQDDQLVALKQKAFPFLFFWLYFNIGIELRNPHKYLFHFIQSIKSSFEDDDLGDSDETTQTNNSQGEYFLHQRCFFMLPHHTFDFEFSYVV